MPTLFPTDLPVSAPVRRVLESLVRRTSTPQQQALRARVILEMAEGGTNPEIAELFDLHPTSVRKLRQRWLEAQTSFDAVVDDEKALRERIVELLRGKTSPGRNHTFMPEQVAGIVALACESPEEAGLPVTHWTCTLLAEEAVNRGIVESISRATVNRFLKSGRSKASSGSSLAHRRED